MKKLIIIVVLVVAGYFAYQHFYVPTQDEDVAEEESVADTGSYYNEPAPPTPDACKDLATNLENAIYGNNKGQVSFSQRNFAYRKFRSCLRENGFSDTQINSAVGEIETRVKGYK